MEQGASERQLPLPLGRAPDPVHLSHTTPAPSRPTQFVALHTPDALACRLATRLGAPLSLTVTSNHRRVFSLRLHQGVRCLRVHEIFLGASEKVLDALCHWLTAHDRSALATVDDFVRVHHAKILANRPRPAADPWLCELANSLCAEHFPQMSPPHVSWARARLSRRRARSRVIRLGAWLSDSDVIVLHPSLSARWVPTYYLSWVLFHELSHRALGLDRTNSTRLHGRAFRELEAQYPHRELALAWEQSHLRHLIDRRSAPQL